MLHLHYSDIIGSKGANSGIDMQLKFNEYLVTLLDKKDNNLDTQQFQEDKAYFHNALESIENENVKLVSHNDVWKAIEKHTQKN